MKAKKEWWEGWGYKVAYNPLGSFDGIVKTNKRDDISTAKYFSKLHPNADVYVYRFYRNRGWQETEQTTIWMNDNFKKNYAMEVI